MLEMMETTETMDMEAETTEMTKTTKEGTMMRG